MKEAPEAEPDPWDENRFFDKNREGWFWYLEMKKEEKRVRKREAPSRQLPPTLNEMRKQAEKLLSRAVEEPTEAHLLAYIQYQRLVMQRAEAFAHTWQRVLWEHPDLDPTVENPVVTAGLSVARAEKAKKRDAKLLNLARSSGIFYFFAGDCPLCEIQSPLLAGFARSYGFSVVPISLDGAEDPLFGSAKVDRGAAERLGVSAAPAIFLVRPQTGEVLRVGTGLLSMEELGERLDRLAGHVEEER
ncbi:conjugal transfer protein TraF [Candidatus Manganitrophus noduliformans]|nr:conjugal transfer protein TraF [Candidatus Manganitrophus noduliformans]